jgi:hypothetical protein
VPLRLAAIGVVGPDEPAAVAAVIEQTETVARFHSILWWLYVH